MDTKDILDEPRMSEKQLLRRLRRTKSLRERQSVKVNTKETEIDKIDPRGLFTREQLLEFEIAFDEYDTFSTGFIYSHQLVSLMRNLGLNPTSKELEAFIMKYAVEGQTKIYLDEFFLIVYDKLSQVDATQEAFEVRTHLLDIKNF
jgi:Ca2+-binding EF-hand superfamily protein